MPIAKLNIGEREYPLGSARATIGRATDNDVAFPDDSNVSRYHAEIESRGGEYWLIDLGSSNGTSVNGGRVTGERLLASGDVIELGGSARLQIDIQPEQKLVDDDPVESSPVAPVVGTISPPITPQVSNSRAGIILVVAAGAVVLVAVMAVGAIYMFSGSSCAAKAAITKPEAGDTIIAATEIEVDVENAACVARAVFTIDGIEFADAADPPYAASIDPKEFPELADGYDHALAVSLFDENGTQIGGTEPVVLAFETREIEKPGADIRASTQASGQPVTPRPSAGTVSLIDINEMSKRLVKQFPSGTAYNISNKQFLQEVQKRTAEYAQEGYFERASKYRDVTNIAFVREQNLDAPLGFLLAMSRSKFNPEKLGGDEGLWRMNPGFAAANGYTGLCGTESLSDPSQACAAKAASIYMKSLVLGVFDGDVIYAVAAFGKSPQDAAAWKSALPANRSNVWNSVKGPAEREQLIRFFAAGIVAENPQKFGLKKDRALSELYRLAM